MFVLTQVLKVTLFQLVPKVPQGCVTNLVFRNDSEKNSSKEHCSKLWPKL